MCLETGQGRDVVSVTLFLSHWSAAQRKVHALGVTSADGGVLSVVFHGDLMASLSSGLARP